MRFPHELYAKMMEQERTTSPQHVAKKSAAEKKVVSESAIEDDPEDNPEDDSEDNPEDDHEDDLVN